MRVNGRSFIVLAAGLAIAIGASSCTRKVQEEVKPAGGSESKGKIGVTCMDLTRDW